MEKAMTAKRYSAEVRLRAVRIVLEHGAAPSQRDPAQGVGVFCDGGARPPVQAMIGFIDVIALPTGSSRSAGFCRSPQAPTISMQPSAPIPPNCPARAGRDANLQTDIKRVWDANFQVYGVRKVWRQLQREAIAAPRCQVARLMKRMGLAGTVRGRTVKTTHSDKSTPSPPDRVNRQIRAPAPNALWLSDFTYVATWQGFVYVAFVIDAFARRIVGWRVSRSARADFVLDALEQALCDRPPSPPERPRAPQRSRRATWVQPVVATVMWANRRVSSNASAGVFQRRVLRGLVFRASATAWRAFLL